MKGLYDSEEVGEKGVMRIYVITSNEYSHLISGCLERIKRSWVSVMPPVTVLYYDEIPSGMDFAGVDFHSLGRQADFGKSWTDGLIPFFAQAETPELFIIMLEDYWLDYPVNGALISYLALKFRDPQVVKVGLTNDALHYPHEETRERGLLLAAQDARYRGSSLQAAIWRKGYFRKLLKPDRTAWEFELKGEKECAFDGTRQYFVRDSVMRYENKMKKGKTI